MYHSNRTGCWTWYNPNQKKSGQFQCNSVVCQKKYKHVLVRWRCAKVRGHAELKVTVKTFSYHFPKLHHSNHNSFGANVHLCPNYKKNRLRSYRKVHRTEISVGLPVFYRFENLYEAKARVRYNTDTWWAVVDLLTLCMNLTNQQGRSQLGWGRGGDRLWFWGRKAKSLECYCRKTEWPWGYSG